MSLLRNYPTEQARQSATLSAMRAYVNSYKMNPAIKALAADLWEQASQLRPPLGYVAVVTDWVRGHVRYQPDPADVEDLQTPTQLIMTAAGDCDDLTTLTATLLAAKGFQTRFAVATQESGVIHVYPLAFIGPRGWIPADACRPDSHVPLPAVQTVMVGV